MGVALVTGANRGIGYAIAEGLGRMGHTMLMGSRDNDGGAVAAEELRSSGLDARSVLIDVTDQATISAAADAIESEFGHLDVLVNNAAIKLDFHPAPPSAASLSMVRETYETNVFGTIAVLLTMLPLLRKAEAARIVNMSSGLASLTLATTPGTKYADKPMLGYSTAKTAVNAITVQFANELRDTPIKVNAADPGYTRTGMTRFDGNRSTQEAAAVAIRLATLPADGPTASFLDADGELPW